MPRKIYINKTAGELSSMGNQLDIALNALRGIVLAMERKGITEISCSGSAEMERALGTLPGFVNGAQLGLSEAVGQLTQQRAEQAANERSKQGD